MHDPGGSSEPSDLSTFETKQLSVKKEERDLDTSESQDEGVICSLANNDIPVLGLWFYCLAPDKINMFEMSHGAGATRDPSKKQDDKQLNNSATEEEYSTKMFTVYDPGGVYGGGYNFDQSVLIVSGYENFANKDQINMKMIEWVLGDLQSEDTVTGLRKMELLPEDETETTSDLSTLEGLLPVPSINDDWGGAHLQVSQTVAPNVSHHYIPEVIVKHMFYLLLDMGHVTLIASKEKQPEVNWDEVLHKSTDVVYNFEVSQDQVYFVTNLIGAMFCFHCTTIYCGGAFYCYKVVRVIPTAVKLVTSLVFDPGGLSIRAIYILIKIACFTLYDPGGANYKCSTRGCRATALSTRRSCPQATRRPWVTMCSTTMSLAMMCSTMKCLATMSLATTSLVMMCPAILRLLSSRPNSRMSSCI